MPRRLLPQSLRSLCLPPGPSTDPRQVLCTGEGPEIEALGQALLQRDLVIRSARGCADAARLMACREFCAVVIAPALPDTQLQALWLLLRRTAPDRTRPVYLRLADPRDHGQARVGTAGGLAPTQAAEQVGQLVHSRSSRRQFLAEARLEALEDSEQACGEVLADAYSAYVQSGASLMDAIRHAQGGGNPTGMGESSHALACMAEQLGDLRTAAAAHQLSWAAIAGQAVSPRAVEHLASARLVGVQSLMAYLSADSLHDRVDTAQSAPPAWGDAG